MPYLLVVKPFAVRLLGLPRAPRGVLLSPWQSPDQPGRASRPAVASPTRGLLGVWTRHQPVSYAEWRCWTSVTKPRIQREAGGIIGSGTEIPGGTPDRRAGAGKENGVLQRPRLSIESMVEVELRFEPVGCRMVSGQLGGLEFREWRQHGGAWTGDDMSGDEYAQSDDQSGERCPERALGHIPAHSPCLASRWLSCLSTPTAVSVRSTDWVSPDAVDISSCTEYGPGCALTGTDSTSLRVSLSPESVGLRGWLSSHWYGVTDQSWGAVSRTP